MNEFYNKMNYFENVEKIPAEIYYHYTSLDALYNIVTSKTFRLTSLKSSNDKKELFYKPEQFLCDLQKLCENESDENTRNYLQLISTSIERNKNDFLKRCKEKRFPYALCLSEKKDNLTHWDRYASGCTGVCIGLNVSALNVYLQRMTSFAFGVGLYDVGKVFYSEEQREMYIKGGLIQFANLLYENKKSEDESLYEFVRKNGFTYATAIYTQLAKFVKNDSFIDEDEVRLYHDSGAIKSTIRLMDLAASNMGEEVICNLKRNLLDVVRELEIKQEEFYMSRSGIRGYKRLCLKEVWGSGTIPEIILGPMCVQNRNELRRFLRANGLEGTKVTVSNVPIR